MYKITSEELLRTIKLPIVHKNSYFKTILITRDPFKLNHYIPTILYYIYTYL